MTPDGKKETDRRPVFTDNGSALNCYLNDVGKYPVLDADAQKQLGEEIDRTGERLETLLRGIGFAAQEYLRMIRQVNSGESNPADFFLYSSLSGGKGELPGELNAILQQWGKRIEQKFELLKKSPDSADAREALRSELKLFRLNGLMTAELYQTAVGYEKLNDSSCRLMRERFLMNGQQAAETLKQLHCCKAELDALHQRMAVSNLRLVISIAQRYRECGIPLGDIIQEGNLGLMLAIERFDYNLGNKFSTYAGWWIKHHILRGIAEQSRVIRLPLHMVQAIQNMNKVEQRMVQTLGRAPEIDELVAALEMPLPRVSALRKMAEQTLSLQAPVGNGDDETVLESLISPADNSEPWRNLAQKQLYDKLNEMLNLLPERERQIIIYRFGLCGEPVLSLTEISSRVNLSRERVRQLESRIMEQLRSSQYLKFLDGLSHLD